MKIPPVRPWIPQEDREEILEKIGEALDAGMLSGWKNTPQFEAEFARYIGTTHAVAVNSGTSSIEIPLRALGVEGGEVLVQANTFFASAAAVYHAGGRVRFVDSDPDTFSIDVDSLRSSISKDTVGVMVVHIGGIITPRMAEIQEICQERGLFLFEDAAHAHGSAYNGQMAGTFGVAASFSFYPTKVITSGEGGVITTSDETVYKESIIYRDQGKADSSQNLHTRLGNNWRMSELHAIVGLTQVRRLEEFIEVRARTAAIFDEGLESVPGVEPLALAPGVRSSYYKYIAMLDPGLDRSRLKALLQNEYDVRLGGEVYDTPLHLQPIFQGSHRLGDFPKAEEICRRHICLPLSAAMSIEEAQYVVASLREAVGRL